MKRATKAVINCKITEFIKLNTLAGRVVEKMTENASEFPGTATKVATLNTSQELFTTLIATAKGNSIIVDQRNEHAKVVLSNLQTLLTLVNMIAGGNKATITLSGFAGSSDLTPRPVPNQVVIKRIVKGETELSAKIFIISLKQRDLCYTVRTTSVAGAGVNDPSWKVVLYTSSSYKLVLPDLVKNQNLYISVSATNTRGEGIFSDPMRFSAK